MNDKAMNISKWEGTEEQWVEAFARLKKAGDELKETLASLHQPARKAETNKQEND